MSRWDSAVHLHIVADFGEHVSFGIHHHHSLHWLCAPITAKRTIAWAALCTCLSTPALKHTWRMHTPFRAWTPVKGRRNASSSCFVSPAAIDVIGFSVQRSVRVVFSLSDVPVFACVPFLKAQQSNKRPLHIYVHSSSEMMNSCKETKKKRKKCYAGSLEASNYLQPWLLNMSAFINLNISMEQMMFAITLD